MRHSRHHTASDVQASHVILLVTWHTMSRSSSRKVRDLRYVRRNQQNTSSLSVTTPYVTLAIRQRQRGKRSVTEPHQWLRSTVAPQQPALTMKGRSAHLMWSMNLLDLSEKRMVSGSHWISRRSSRRQCWAKASTIWSTCTRLCIFRNHPLAVPSTHTLKQPHTLRHWV